VSADAHAAVSIRSLAETDTERIGAALGAILQPGAVVGLAGPLGAGKTCFARGLAMGLGVDPSLVASPTFVYLVDYPGKPLTLYHADLYRLLELPEEHAVEVYESIGLFAAFTAGGITVVEWWDGYRGPEPASLVRVEFVMENADHRRLTARFATPASRGWMAAFEKQLGRSGLTP